MKECKVYEWSHHILGKHTHILTPKHMFMCMYAYNALS